MSLVISHNFAASYAARHLEKNDDNLRNSLNKLSSGQRIVRPTDDAGGMAVQLKMKASIARAQTAKHNIQNAISILQTQDGILQTATEVVSRIAELKAMSTDATKNTADLQNYNEEYQVLRQQLIDLQTESFNGVALFSDTTTHGTYTASTAGHFEFFTTEQGNSAGAPSVQYAGQHLASAQASGGGTGIITESVATDFADASDPTVGIANTNLTMDNILADLQSLANARARNGANQSRLGFAYDNASIGKSNMESARSRIIDVDIAEESTRFASYNILTQASASMLAQANQTGRTALQLLMG